MAMIVLKSELQKNNFLISLEKTYPKNFTEMLTRAKKYINAKEAYDALLVPTKAKAN